jgi:hypothetical protein
MRLLIPALLAIALVGCATAEDRQNYREAQIQMVERQMLARQRMELDRAQAQAQWALAMAKVAETSPESADAIAVALAVTASRGGSEAADLPVMGLQREDNEVREWAKVITAPLLGTITQVGIAALNTDLAKTQSDNMAKIQMNEDAVDGQQFEVLGGVAAAVSTFGATAIQSAGGNTTYTYTASDEALLDMSVTTTTSGDTISGDTNSDSYNTQGDTNADSYNTSGDTSTDSSDNSDNSVTNPTGP